MKKLLLICLLANLFMWADAQFIAVNYLQKDSFTNHLEALKDNYGMNKIIPPVLETECLTALQFYPELKTVNIEFRFGKASTTMSSRPTLSSLLKNRNKRLYIVTINQDGASKLGLKWNELSFNQTVGWIGHELGHILHYTQKTNGGILWMGYKYSFARYKRKMERFTDQLAIGHNLGFALYDGTEYTLNCSNAKKSYKNNAKIFYLKPNEILQKSYTRDSVVANYRKTKFSRKSNVMACLK
ncbi:hypothetical protein [Flavihumibacter profundi]|uniref:hypothetical protein n=1 Tax=Flavihumibacter profundi TaxID=2716883 RepID=UPI001CC54E9C|nr:hypothetical protein [Flavihumibacter profundi]MBZ5858310.1 hypothetical protein [Flavihumibacter profundi]